MQLPCFTCVTAGYSRSSTFANYSKGYGNLHWRNGKGNVLL